MALRKRTDIRRVSAAAVFAAATLNASPLYLAVLSEQTASDAAWLAVAETLAECHGSETLIKNQKFSSDCTWVGIFGWMSASVAVCDAKDPMRKVLFGKRVKGYGYGYGLTPVEAFTIPLNMSYWTVLSGIEKAIRSQEFEAVIKCGERSQ